MVHLSILHIYAKKKNQNQTLSINQHLFTFTMLMYIILWALGPVTLLV